MVEAMVFELSVIFFAKYLAMMDMILVQTIYKKKICQRLSSLATISQFHRPVLLDAPCIYFLNPRLIITTIYLLLLHF